MKRLTRGILAPLAIIAVLAMCLPSETYAATTAVTATPHELVVHQAVVQPGWSCDVQQPAVQLQAPAEQPQPFQMPGWLIGLLPVINYGLNEFLIRLAPNMSGTDKRNLVRAVSITIVLGLVIFRAVTAPAPPTGSTLLEDWAPYALLLLGWIWAGAQVVHDGIDAAGKRVSGAATPTT